MRVPLAKVGLRVTTFLPGPLDSLLVRGLRAAECLAGLLVGGKRSGNLVYDDIVGPTDIPADEGSSSLGILFTRLYELVHVATRTGKDLKTPASRSREGQIGIHPVGSGPRPTRKLGTRQLHTHIFAFPAARW